MTFSPAFSEAQAWDIVQRRDQAFDGRFFFAVSTTGIYCRPSCPARRPRRDNVRFFETRGDAETAGFRACQRCRPAAERGPVASLAARVRKLLDAHPDGITLAELARRTGVSPHHLQRVFREQTGITPKQYLAAVRAARLRAKLKQGVDVTTAIFEAGYGSSSRLYAQSDSLLGMTPATYRDGGRGVDVRYTIVVTSHGPLVVATTDRGICAVLFGDERALRDELPNAMLVRDDESSIATLVHDLDDDVDPELFQLRIGEKLRSSK